MGAVAVARTRPCGTRKRQANQADADASGANGGGAGRVARSHGWQIVPIDFTSESAVDASLPHLDGVLHKVTDLLTAGDDVSHAALQRVAVSGASATCLGRGRSGCPRHTTDPHGRPAVVTGAFARHVSSGADCGKAIPTVGGPCAGRGPVDRPCSDAGAIEAVSGYAPRSACEPPATGRGRGCARARLHPSLTTKQVAHGAWNNFPPSPRGPHLSGLFAVPACVVVPAHSNAGDDAVSAVQALQRPLSAFMQPSVPSGECTPPP